MKRQCSNKKPCDLNATTTNKKPRPKQSDPPLTLLCLPTVLLKILYFFVGESMLAQVNKQLRKNINPPGFGIMMELQDSIYGYDYLSLQLNPRDFTPSLCNGPGLYSNSESYTNAMLLHFEKNGPYFPLPILLQQFEAQKWAMDKHMANLLKHLWKCIDIMKPSFDIFSANFGKERHNQDYYYDHLWKRVYEPEIQVVVTTSLGIFTSGLFNRTDYLVETMRWQNDNSTKRVFRFLYESNKKDYDIWHAQNKPHFQAVSYWGARSKWKMESYVPVESRYVKIGETFKVCVEIEIPSYLLHADWEHLL
jgi:hypothetical protein